MSLEILDAPLREIARSIREGEVKSEDVTRGFLDRIAAVNPSLNAVILLLEEQVMTEAKKADEELKAGGLRGLLHGVPMTIKDSLDTFDAVTTWGTLGRREVRPGADATCVARLRNAGALIMGKTNTPEFTLDFETDNLLFGRTNNPFDLARTPGGSSGGAAAIIAAGASPLDIGTDTGGSIRLPSHFCGIAGIKPTTGRVPCTGNALPYTGIIAPLSQPGPMARRVDDLVYALSIIAGPDGIDPHAVPAPLLDPADVDVTALRVGFHLDNGIKTPIEDIQTVVRHVTDLMRAEGMKLTEARPTGVEMAQFVSGRVFGADAGEMVDALLEDCHTTETSAPITASREQRLPAASAREVAQTINLWHNYQSSMLGFFRDFDVLVCPVNADVAVPHGTTRELDGYSYTMAYNLTGWPGAVIRAGTSANGLPIGVQILAAPYREDRCLAVAAWLETRLGAFDGPALA